MLTLKADCLAELWRSGAVLRPVKFWRMGLLISSILTSVPAWTAVAKPLPAVMQQEFGAAAWVPEEVGCFAAKYRLRERWQAFAETRVYQEILTMPAVQLGLGWLGQQPYWEQLAELRANNWLLDNGLEVLQDAFSQEVFIYVDARGPIFMKELGGLYNATMWNGLLQGINENNNALPSYTESKNRGRLIRNVLEVEHQLRVPGVVCGFRLADPQAGRDFLLRLAPLLRQLTAVPIQEVSHGGGEFLTLPLSGAMFLTPELQSKLEAELEMSDVDRETTQQFVRLVKLQTLSFSLGMRDDYLLFSLGADNSHLAQLGKGTSLADSAALAPLRQQFQSRLISLSYVHPALTSYAKMDVEKLVVGLRDILQQMPSPLPVGLAKRITADARQLLHEINESLPVARAKVSASFWKEGIASLSFAALPPESLVSSEPLSILARTGQSPLLALASRSPSRLTHYNRLVAWLQTVHGYFSEYVAGQIPAEGRADFDAFQAIALPALQRLHETTRDFLLPSLANGQSLFVLDAGGVLAKSPDTQRPLAKPIRFPRPALVREIADRGKFVTAWQQYRATFNALMKQVAQHRPNVAEVVLPPPSQRSFASGMLYTYPLPADVDLASYLNDDFEPHAVLTSDLLVLSLSPLHTEQLLANHHESPAAQLVFQQPAGRAAWFDGFEFKELLCDDAEAILALVEEQGAIDANMKLLIQIHVDKLRKIFGAVQNYRSRTYASDGWCVKQSYLQLQDIGP